MAETGDQAAQSGAQGCCKKIADEMHHRFAFGKNWQSFLGCLNDERISEAVISLLDLTGRSNLEGLRFLDIGSGSGIFSLAAYQQGADVTSFDFDVESVNCTRTLKERYANNKNNWNVMQGSILDDEFVASLGEFDIVYAWGVLHHTGDMWRALENASKRVAPRGTWVVSIYNDQGWRSSYWRFIKKMYNSAPFVRPLLIMLYYPYFVGLRYLVRVFRGREKLERGMSYWHDMVDWLGGFPFEVAKPEKIFAFASAQGFDLRKLRTCGGRSGCNEFVFQKEN